MSLAIYRRFMYDDVTLLASVDQDASAWALAVDDPTHVGFDAPRWVPIEAKIVDEHLNWSTTDLSDWASLSDAEPGTIERVFPEANPAVPVGLPMAVMWDISAWTFGMNPRTGASHGFRFTDPQGSTHEFKYASLGGAGRQPFQVGE